LKIFFLGTGTSTGIPEIGCKCEVCQSSDKKDKRLRASVLIAVKGKRILIDCGPDFREQLLDLPFQKIDAVLLTHEHYDHVGGLDDLRPFCRFGDVRIFAESKVSNSIQRRMPYIFVKDKYPGVPRLEMVEITNKPFLVNDVEVTPIRVMHYTLGIFAYRIGSFAYITDMKTIPDEELPKLENLDVLVVNALRIQEHLSHQNLEQALAFADRVKAKATYFIHMSHDMGLHAEVEKTLPANIFFAYDKLQLEIETI
jgi:phosphoribosyl 1,2-cyclic phosphate phosphodiesterase